MTLCKIVGIHNKILGLTHYLVAPLLLLARLYIANIFFKSGLTKIRDWESTLMLFEYEYEVPLIPFELAAWAGTIGELVLPVLLVLGLFTRVSAIGLFFVNAVAVISLSEISPAAMNEHILWGSVIFMLIILGAEKFSLDRKFQVT